MSTPTAAVAEMTVPAGAEIVAFVHRLGGPVDVIGYDVMGNRIGVIANPITDDEVEVIDVTGQVIRLVATPARDDDGDAMDGDLTDDRY